MTAKEQTERSNRKLKTSFKNRRVSTFAVCVLISAAFWLLHAFSKEYTLIIRIPLKYSHVPDHNLVPVAMPDSIDVEVTGSGFSVFAYNWTNSAGALDIDMRQGRSLGHGDYALATFPRSERLEGAIGHGFSVLRVMPDTIVVSFAGTVQKQVPVRPRVHVRCAPMYRMGDSIKTDPAFVTVTGAETLLKQVREVETEEKSFDGLDHSVNEPVKLVLPENFGQLTLEPPEVHLIIPVGQYTEKRISVPVETINVPPDVVLKTFPDKVDVVFQVLLKDFPSIHADMFRVVADYNKTDPKSNTIQLEIVRQPLNVSNLRTDPLKVEYIIRK